MDTKPVEIVWTINVVKQHQVAINAQVDEELVGTLTLKVDGQQVLSVPLKGEEFDPKVHHFTLDEHELELRWFWGDTPVFVLMDGQTKLASYGDPEDISDMVKSDKPGSTIATTKIAVAGITILIVLVSLVGAGWAVWRFALKPDDNPFSWDSGQNKVPANHKYETTFYAPGRISADVTVIADGTMYLSLVDPHGNALVDDAKVIAPSLTKSVHLSTAGVYTVWLTNINLFEGKFVQVWVRETKK